MSNAPTNTLRAAVVVGMIAALPAAAQSVNGQGGFPVFGSSPERAEFFQNQADQQQERVDEIRRAEREAEARAAEAAAAAEVREERTRRRGIASRPAPYCFRVVDRERDVRLGTRVIGGEVVRPRAFSRSADDRTEIYCVPYRFGTYFRRPENRTAIQIGIDGDGISGRAVIERPGLDVDLNFD